MQIVCEIITEFVNQSVRFQNNTEVTRLKRIQNIFRNSYLLIYYMYINIFIRGLILLIEKSSFGTEISFAIFLPIMFIIAMFYHNYVKKNRIIHKKDCEVKGKSISTYENEIGFYSSLISLGICIFIPFTIYYEYDKFDKGIQFMMSKVFLNFTDIVLMQPKKHAQFIEIVFTISYCVILFFKTFSFINMFFIITTCISSSFIFQLAEQLNYIYSIFKKKEKMLKFNDEIFQMIDEPILVTSVSLEIFFKNEKFNELQFLCEGKDELAVFKKLEDENHKSLYQNLINGIQRENSSQNLPLIFNENSSPKLLTEISDNIERKIFKEQSSIYSLIYNPKGNDRKKASFHVKIVRKKLKKGKQETVFAIYFHDLENEIEKKVLQKDKEFTNLILYSLSHEIRTPINAIKGILYLMKGKLEDIFDQRIKMALNCTKFLVNQINCILDYAQIIKKEFKLHFSEVDLPRLLFKIKKMNLNMLLNKSSSLKIEIRVAPEIPQKIVLDYERLKQILLILIGNAIKYTESGGITISARFKDINEILFSVCDTGCGFKPYQVDLFNKLSKTFHNLNLDRISTVINGNINQRQDNLKDESQFPGYKLSLCLILILSLDSRLILSSRESVGSSFSFSIPINLIRQNIEHPFESISTPNISLEFDEKSINNMQIKLFWFKTKTMSDLIYRFQRQSAYQKEVNVLIVDDIDLNRFVIVEMLKKLEVKKILEIANGLESIKVAKKLEDKGEDFLIFMDIDMPILNGFETTKLIRKFSQKPIVALTAFIGEEMRIKAKESGMDQFITKPLSFKKLRSILQEYKVI